MARYLLVAHQTAESRELKTRVMRLLQEDPAGEFVLLVPATPVAFLDVVGGESRTALQIARSRASSARKALEEVGARVTSARIGSYDPFVAIQEVLRVDDFQAVVLTTLPPGISRWLRLDLPARVTRAFPEVRLIHVIAQPAHVSS